MQKVGGKALISFAHAICNISDSHRLQAASHQCFITIRSSSLLSASFSSCSSSQSGIFASPRSAPNCRISSYLKCSSCSYCSSRSHENPCRWKLPLILSSTPFDTSLKGVSTILHCTFWSNALSTVKSLGKGGRRIVGCGVRLLMPQCEEAEPLRCSWSTRGDNDG